MRLDDTAAARATIARQMELAASDCMPEEYSRLRMEMYYNLGDYAAVVSEGNGALETYRGGSSACEIEYYLARAYDRQSNTQACLEHYNSVITNYASSTDPGIRGMVSIALSMSAKILANQGGYSEAANRLQRIITDYPDTEMAKSAGISLKRLQRKEGN